jgi:hypothetical protein
MFIAASSLPAWLPLLLANLSQSERQIDDNVNDIQKPWHAKDLLAQLCHEAEVEQRGPAAGEARSG